MALVDIVLPLDHPADAESVVERWLRKPGDRVRAHEPLLEVNTDKAVVEIAAPAGGVLQEILKGENQPIKSGDVLGRIAVGAASGGREPSGEGDEETRRRGDKERGPSGAGAAAPSRVLDLSPAVRQLVKQHNLDLAQITGTGRGGRITHADVQNYLKGRPAAAGSAAGRRVPHSPLRRQIAQHMVKSLLQTAPHVTAVFDADLSAVVAHRLQNQESFQRRDVKLTYTAYFVTAAVKALRAVPEVNSRWHDDALEVFEDCNVGVAAAVPGGLVVPVVHRAQTLDLFGIAARLQELTAKARDGKLERADLQGGTFTITNHGVSGSLIATPIINQPQSAILGVGKLEKRVVVVERQGEDAILIKPMAYVTLTIDHRALDGFQANAFLAKFVEALGEWSV